MTEQEPTTLQPKTPQSAYSKELADKYHSEQQKAFKKEGVAHDQESVRDISTEGLQEYLHDSLIVKTNAHIIDIGCGARADFLEKWKHAGNVALVIGIEPSQRMRELLKKHITDDQIQVQEGHWLDTGLPKDAADAVVSRFSFHHVQDIDKAYEELARILKFGAKASIAVPHPEYVKAEFATQGKKLIDRAEITVNVLGLPITYFYHSLEDYFHCPAFEKYFKLIDTRVGDFKKGAWEIGDSEVPNTLIFEIEKVTNT